MRATRIWATALIGLGLALAATNLSAQTTGTIYGQVSDSSGAAIPGASIEALNTATTLSEKGISDPLGTYRISALPPGPYKITVEHAGFETYVQSGITVVVNENARVDANLKLGAVTQVVSVTAAAQSVDTQSSVVGTTVDDLRVEAMPLNGRNLFWLTQLLPGVGMGASATAVDSGFDTVTTTARSGATFNVSGARGQQNNIQLDGTWMVEAMYNYGVDLPSPDAIQEFRALTNTFNAEYGRSAGGIFLAVTKSGTNQFHGSLFEYGRNTDLNARNFFSTTKPYLRQNQFGGSLGGPVRLPGYNGRDKTFFFFNYQAARIRQQSLITMFSPNAAERQGVFPTAITDPTTGQPFANNTIPASRFDPMAKNIEALVPLPTLANGENITLLPIPINDGEYTAKIDHEFSASSRLSFRFYRNKSEQGNLEGGNVIVQNGGIGSTSYNLDQTENLRYTKVVSPTLMNEAEFSHLRVDPYYVPQSGLQSARQLGGLANEEGSIPWDPSAAVNGWFSFATTGLFAEPEDSFLWGDKLHWMHGRHALTFGGEVERIRHSTRALDPPEGVTFNGAFTGNPLADYTLGVASTFTVQSGVLDDSSSTDVHPFIEDDVKVTRRLTLNLGVRYELNTPWVETHNEVAAYRPGQQSTVFPTAPPSVVYPGDPGLPRATYKADKNDFMPRVGFAWDPTGNGRTSVRAGYGVFKYYTGASLESNPNQIAPYDVILSPTMYTFSDPWGVTIGKTDPWPYIPSKTNPVFIYPLYLFSIDPKFRDGYTMQWNFNLQHDFSHGVFVQAGYVGLRGLKMLHKDEIDQPIYGPGATAANVQARRPIEPQYFSGIGNLTSDANSDYHSLQVSVNKKWSSGYTLQLAYTHGKSIDDATSAINGTLAQNGYNYRTGERGLSDFDQRNIYALNGIWAVPFMRTNRVVGGWQLAGILRYGSGFPFSVNSGLDPALVGSDRSLGPERMNLVGNWRLDTSRSHAAQIAEYFNKAAFAVPSTGNFGNSGRNIVEGPGFCQTDASLQKSFKLPGERGAFQFRVDAFNLWNQVNFLNPTNTYTSPAFGQILGSQTPRIFQLALRYDF